MGFILSLWNSNPECEINQLRLLINKLVSQPTVIQETHRLISRNSLILPKKLSSKVPYLLLQLQTTPPAMKTIIVSAIESEVLLCPGNGLRAKYHAIITPNKTILWGEGGSGSSRETVLYQIFVG